MNTEMPPITNRIKINISHLCIGGCLFVISAKIRRGSKAIGNGHARTKHVQGVNNIQGREFDNGIVINGLAFPKPSILTKKEFREHIKEIMDKPDDTQTVGGVTYYWDDDTGTLVVHGPGNKDKGTAFRPDNGKKTFDDKWELPWISRNSRK